MTINELLADAEKTLHAAKVPSPRFDAEALLAFAMNLPRAKLPVAEPTKEQIERFYALLARRAERYPLQYLVGEIEWYDLRLEMDERVFIPTPSTERLAELAIGMTGEKPWRVIDVCTGSGNLAIAVARHCPHAEVTAIDINPAAVDLARRNAERNGVRLRVLRGDLLTAVRGRADLIVSNPPYIPRTEFNLVAPEVLFYEPFNAVYGGQDGLMVIRKLVPQAMALAPRLIFECSHTHAPAVRELLNKFRVTMYKDHEGFERIVLCERG